ncbi:MAG TPA: GNAT family N-acetyltransferase [Thermoanaerobaculia bacterium]|nr:GNAT family N-acetyltransferase [Thermoanaerobaculia bacterium]
MRIRHATPADAPALAALAERTFRDTFGAQNRAEDMDAHCARTYGEALQRREIEDRSASILVAEEDETIVAYAYLRHQPSQWGDVELARFYVDAPYHGRGIAQRLMHEVEQRVKGRKLWLGVWEHNPRAIRFYEKCGFTKAGTHPFLVGSDLQTDHILTRVIPST